MMHIGFTTPLFLIGTAATLIVLLIHLLKRPKTIKMTFSSLRFFSSSAVSAKRSRSLRKWLLLITRMLVIFLLALLFAGPYPKNEPLHRLVSPSSDLYLVIDNTPSMEYQQPPHSPARLATIIADSILGLQQSSRGVYLYQADSGSFTPCVKNKPVQVSSGGYFDKKQFLSALTTAATTSRHSACIILSDFQQPFSTLCDTIFADTALARVAVAYTPLTPDSPWNSAVTAVYPRAGFESALLVHIVSHANRAVTGLLSATIGNMRTVPILCTLATRSDTVVNLPVPLLATGETGIVTFKGNDPLPFDNSRYFVVPTSEQRTILIIGAQESVFPLQAAIMATSSPAALRTVSSCTHAELSIAKMIASQVIIVCGGEGAAQTINLISQTAPVVKQSVILAPDSTYYMHSSLWKTTEQPLTLRLSDTVSTLWKGFPSLRADEVAVYGYSRSLVGTPVAFLANGTPFVSFGTDPQGRALVSIASPIDATVSNNLCETAFFVPFIDRLLGYLESTSALPGSAWIVGSAVKNPFFGSERQGVILDPSGAPLHYSPHERYITVPAPGLYKVCPPEGAAYGVTAAFNRDESIPVYHLPSESPAASSFRTVLSPEELLAYLSHNSSAFWRWIPWIMLGILFLAEVLLREKRPPSNSPRH